MSEPSLHDLLAYLAQAQASGQWLPDDLYPHEYAQLACYAMRRLGHRVEIERQLFTVKSEQLEAQGTNSAMVYGYCLSRPDVPRQRISLRGTSGEDAIEADVLAHCGHPGAYFSSKDAWDRFPTPPLSRYLELGRQYRLTPEQAGTFTDHAEALLRGMTLDAATQHTRPGSSRRL